MKSNLIYARSLPDTREAASKRNGVLHCPQSAMSGMTERMRINNADHFDSQTVGQTNALRYHILGIHRDTEIENPGIGQTLAGQVQSRALPRGHAY